MVEDADVVGHERQRLVEPFERIPVLLERMQHLAEIGQSLRRARIDLDRGAEQAMRLADPAELRLDGAEQVERVEMIRRGFEHARVNLLGVAQPALPVQRQGLVHGLSEVERAGLLAHRRLIRAMRRVTSGGVSLSALVFSSSAARAAGRSRQRVSQSFRCGTADKSMSMARLMTAATLRSATVKSLPSRYGDLYGILAKAASSTANGAAMTLSASSRRPALRSCGGRRTACSDQILTPRSTSAMAQKLHCQALASPSSVAG